MLVVKGGRLSDSLQYTDRQLLLLLLGHLQVCIDPEWSMPRQVKSSL